MIICYKYKNIYALIMLVKYITLNNSKNKSIKSGCKGVIIEVSKERGYIGA